MKTKYSFLLELPWSMPMGLYFEPAHVDCWACWCTRVCTRGAEMLEQVVSEWPSKKNKTILVLSAPSFPTVKEGTFEIGTCPTLHSGSNWSIKCWQSIMHLGRWGRQTCWRHIALCLDKSKAVTSSCCREIVSPEGAMHRIDSNFLIWEHTIEICPKKRFYL